MSGNTRLQVIIALSIFVPLIVVGILTWFFLLSAKNDPDEQRLRQVQIDYEQNQKKTQR